MKRFFLAALCFILGVSNCYVRAQSFGIELTSTPNPVIVSNTLTYTLIITNDFAFILPTTTATVTFSQPVSIVSVSNPYGSYTTQSSEEIIFNITTLNPLLSDSILYSVTPTVAGTITNTVNVTSSGAAITNQASLVNSVTEANIDFGITLVGSPQALVLYDIFTYGISITNLSTNNAAGIIITNTIPQGLNLLSVSPSNTSYSIETNLLIININNLITNASDLITIEAQPTNSGSYTITATVGSPGLVNLDTVTGSASATFSVVAPISNELSVVSVSPQTYDPQTGLMDETVKITNISTNTINALRINANNITNLVYNASGTNGAAPYIFYQGNLVPSQSVDILVEYFNPSRVAGEEPIFEGLVVPAITNQIPSGTGVNITSAAWLSGNRFLIEFPSTQGSQYAILYSSSPSMAKLQSVIPQTTAPADRTQWIDHGPPETISPPSQSAQRYYQVIQVQ